MCRGGGEGGGRRVGRGRVRGRLNKRHSFPVQPAHFSATGPADYWQDGRLARVEENDERRGDGKAGPACPRANCKAVTQKFCCASLHMFLVHSRLQPKILKQRPRPIFYSTLPNFSHTHCSYRASTRSSTTCSSSGGLFAPPPGVRGVGLMSSEAAEPCCCWEPDVSPGGMGWRKQSRKLGLSL